MGFFFFQAEDGIRDLTVTGVQTCALPISCILRELAGKNPQIDNLANELSRAPLTLRAGFSLLQTLAAQAAAIVAAFNDQPDVELKWWAQAAERHCREHLEDLLFLAPWLALPPLLARRGHDDLTEKLIQLDQTPTLREVSELSQSDCPLLEEALQHHHAQH